MAKKNRYADWLKANQTVPGSYAELMARNEKIKNTPETVVTGYSAVPKMAQSFGAADNTDVAPTEKYDPAYAEWYAKYGTKAFTKDEYDAANGIVRNQDEFDSLYRSEDGTINGVVRDREKWNERNGVIGTYADYAKQLGVAEQKQQADAAYDRAIPTYGALAEQMAQAGIHGGYGDYLTSQAYATMQNQKYAIDKAARESYADYARENDKEYARQMQEATTAFKQHQHDADAGYAAYLARIREANDAAYQEYTVAQEAQAKADKQARDARVGSLYTRLAKESYTDANGETVQGYGLESVMNDDKYAAAKEQYRQELVNMGATEDEVDEALARVDKVRNQRKENRKREINALIDEILAGDKDNSELLSYYSEMLSGDTEDYSKALKDVLEEAVKRGEITDNKRSAILKGSLRINDATVDASGVYTSVKAAIDDREDKAMTTEDVYDIFKKAIALAEKALGIAIDIQYGEIVYGDNNSDYAYYKAHYRGNADWIPALELIAEYEKTHPEANAHIAKNLPYRPQGTTATSPDIVESSGKVYDGSDNLLGTYPVVR